jgi:hypothetical protein
MSYELRVMSDKLSIGHLDTSQILTSNFAPPNSKLKTQNSKLLALLRKGANRENYLREYSQILRQARDCQSRQPFCVPRRNRRVTRSEWERVKRRPFILPQV